MELNDNQSGYNALLIESIRAGISTRELVGVLPDLRKTLVDTIDTDLRNLAGGKSVTGRVIWGEYGQGKTHFLKLVEKYIIEQGYAVSYLTLSKDLGLNNLYHIFPALTSHVLTKGAQIPGLLNQLIDRKLSPQLYGAFDNLSSKISHPLPVLVLSAFLNYDERYLILLYNTLMGKKENITYSKSILKTSNKAQFQRMPKFRQTEHLMSFIEFFPLLIKAMGYKGWVILLDELEILGRFGKISRLNSYKNLAWLMNLGPKHGLPLYTIAASAGALNEEVFHGSKKQDANEMPKLARDRFSPDIAIAIEELFDIITSEQGMVLEPIQDSCFIPLLEQLMEIHQRAIPWKHAQPDAFVVDTLKRINPSSKPIRQVLRMFIETMDIYASFGEIPGRFMENLVEVYGIDEELPEDRDNDNESPKGFTEKPLLEMFNT